MAYRSSSIKRARRSKAEIDVLKGRLYDLLKDENPMTVRQVFYRAVGAGWIGKTEQEYNGAIVRVLGLMRRSGELPFHWLADSTRWQRKPTTFNNVQHLLDCAAQTYRKDVWQNQSSYVEIWLEKEALAGVLYKETEKWDVPLMVCRGYASLSYLFEAAQEIKDQHAHGKTTHLYYFGDYDPSGLDISRKVESTLREFAPEADFSFERVAVNESQIVELNLPTRPTKKTDSRSKNFEGESVEVDSIMPAQLRAMAKGCIDKHLNWYKYLALQDAEASEKAVLQGWREWLPKKAA